MHSSALLVVVVLYYDQPCQCILTLRCCHSLTVSTPIISALLVVATTSMCVTIPSLCQVGWALMKHSMPGLGHFVLPVWISGFLGWDDETLHLHAPHYHTHTHPHITLSYVTYYPGSRICTSFKTSGFLPSPHSNSNGIKNMAKSFFTSPHFRLWGCFCVVLRVQIRVTCPGYPTSSCADPGYFDCLYLRGQVSGFPANYGHVQLTYTYSVLDYYCFCSSSVPLLLFLLFYS